MMLHIKTAKINRTYQSGMSLVELMVGLVIGLIILGAATSVFLAANSIGRTHDVGARLLEDGAFAASKLAKGIQRAGFVDLFSGTGRFRESFDDAVNTVIAREDPLQRDAFGLRYGALSGLNTAIVGCDDSVIDNSNACVQSGNSSALTIAYQTNIPSNSSDLSPSVTTSVSSGSGSADCNGNPPPSGTDYVINRYFLNSNGQLMCRGNGSNNARAIAENIEQFNVLYGVANGSEDRRVQMLTASQVTANNAWNMVIQVELCLVMLGSPGTDNNPSSRSNCDGTTTATSDTRMRKTFRSVVSLRNNMG